MEMKFMTLACAIVSCAQIASVFAESAPKDVYLLVGQSNMAGRGVLTPSNRVSTARVVKFDRNNKWVEATEPIHFDKGVAGAGIAASFAAEMVKTLPRGREIGLVPCAVGGTSLCRWMPGGDLYANAIKRCRAALADGGTLKGILWHQGENDSENIRDTASYGERLEVMVKAFRKELDAPFVPFVAGELLTAPDRLKGQDFDAVSAATKRVMETLPHCGFASAEGLTLKPDHIHFDTPSLRTFGLRYAAAFREAAAPELDSIFSDGFVFSAKHPTVLTGQAEPGKDVTVWARYAIYRTKAGADGRFSVKLPAFGIQKNPFEVHVTDPNGTRKMKNCLAGLVLLAAGQSNMEVPVDETLDPEKEIAAAKYPLIREFRVAHDFNFVPQRQCGGKWTTVSPKTAAKVGAIGLYTARLLQKEMGGIPVGIVNNSVGGSSIQPWLPLDLNRAKGYRDSFDLYNRFSHLGREGVLKRRIELGKSFLVQDAGNKGEEKGWHKGAQADWKDMKVPGWIDDGGPWGEAADGAFWIARTFVAPDDMLDKDIEFHATAIDDYDITYVNGVKIGATGEETPDSYDQPRAYKIRKGLLKKGENTIAIRIFDTAHAGGVPPGKDSKICLADGAKEFSLAGTWKTQVEQYIRSKSWPADYLPLMKIHHALGALYNAMFAPVLGAPVDAILWYQGESNAGSANYGEMFNDLITRWRADYGEPDLPFVAVQLAAFQARPKSADDIGSWPLTRQHQAEARKLKNVRMVPTIDIGDANRIHPLNKQEIGRRAGLVLLQDFFAPDRFNGVISYPEAMRVGRVGNEIVVTLKDAAGLKTTDGRVPQSFAVVGAMDPKTRKAPAAWATAKIVGETIRVTIPAEIPDPKRVRYAWCMNPDVNTVNGLGFPLLPFDLGVGPEGGVPTGCDPNVMSEAYWKVWNEAEQAKIDADIERNRKSDFVVDLGRGRSPSGPQTDDLPPAGTEVTVEQIEHDFRFGAHIFNYNQLGKKEYNDAYKASYGAGGIFNQATAAFYWRDYEPVPGRLRAGGDYEDTERFWNSLSFDEALSHPFWRRPAPGPVIDYLKSRGVRIHGHILIWGSAKPTWIYDWYCPEEEKRAFDELGIPRHDSKNIRATKSWSGGYHEAWCGSWCQAYERKGVTEASIAAMAPTFVKRMPEIFRKRVFDVAKDFGEVVDSWDVVNESSWDWRRYRKARTGQPVWFSCYGLMPGDYPLHALLDAKEAFPAKAKLAINDWNISPDFLAQVQQLDGEGAKIDIVGCQMHIFNTNDCMRLALGATNVNWVGTPQTIQARLDMMSKTGRPIHVSEITITSPGNDAKSRQIQAILTRNIYRKWFAHKSLMGITWWNTVDGGGVKGEPLVSGLFTRDMKKKPAYEALDELINREWRTSTKAKVEGEGEQRKISFRGFRGRYRLSWKDKEGKLHETCVDASRLIETKKP